MELKARAPPEGWGCGSSPNPFNGIERCTYFRSLTLSTPLENPFNGIERLVGEAPDLEHHAYESIQWN